MELAVTDTGAGMSAEVVARAFEPFFTTKNVGEGSGLGLSMIYGFAKQSNGHVTISSTEGLGTTIQLYLPRSKRESEAAGTDAKDDTPRGRGEVVLVIEDDEDVQDLTVAMLEELGYGAIAVAKAAGADAALKRHDIDVVVSDVVLPGGTSGLGFAEQIRPLYPDLPFIFISGYPAKAAIRRDFLSSGQVLLNKPLERHQLAEALRRALDKTTRKRESIWSEDSQSVATN